MFKKLWNNELGKGTIILFVTLNLYNVFNFLFHFLMGRMLGPEAYGILAVLMSLIYIYSIPSNAIQNLITKYTSKFNAKGEKRKIKFLLTKGIKQSLIVNFWMFVALTLLAIFLSKFLQINFWLIFLTNLTIFGSITVPIVRGVLQGRKQFIYLGNSLIIESIFKVIFSVSLVIFGFKVFGAITGVLIGILSGFVFAMFFNNSILKEKEKEYGFKEIYSASIPYLASMGIITLIFSSDLILAKRFFSAELAGQYAVLSMIGKMIFFGTMAISKAMFPLTAEKKEKKQDASSLFKKSMIMVAILGFASILGCFLFPELLIKLSYGAKYLEISNLLVYSAIAMSLLSLSNLALTYGLSINQMKKSLYFIFFLAIELVLLFNFHDNLKEYVLAFMTSNIFIFIASLFMISKGKEKK